MASANFFGAANKRREAGACWSSACDPPTVLGLESWAIDRPGSDDLTANATLATPFMARPGLIRMNAGLDAPYGDHGRIGPDNPMRRRGIDDGQRSPHLPQSVRAAHK